MIRTMIVVNEQNVLDALVRVLRRESGEQVKQFNNSAWRNVS